MSHKVQKNDTMALGITIWGKGKAKYEAIGKGYPSMYISSIYHENGKWLTVIYSNEKNKCQKGKTNRKEGESNISTSFCDPQLVDSMKEL